MLSRGFIGFIKIRETSETKISAAVAKSATTIVLRPGAARLECIRQQGPAKAEEFFVTVITSLRN
jgi:hypothetical protein